MNDRLHLPSSDDINGVLKLGDRDLPSFPQVAAKLMEASKEEAGSLADLAKVIETDPGLAVRVLEMANSAMAGMRRNISALSEAVVILGLDQVKKMALSLTVFQSFFKSSASQSFDRILFWRHCLCVALLSTEIAKETGYPDPEETYIAGLLHDLGKIFLDTRGHQDYGKFITSVSTSTDIVIDEERRLFGLGHDDIGAYFCSQWGLPSSLALTAKYHHQPYSSLGLSDREKHLIAIVSLADFLCWTQGLGSFDFIRPPVVSPEVEKNIDLETLNIVECMLRMNKEIESISQFYGFIFPSAGQLRENILQANLKLSRANTRYYFQDDPLARFETSPQSQSSDLGLEIGKPLAKAKTVKEVLDIVMYQIGQIFQPRDWSVLLKDSKTGDMVFSLVVGQNKKKLQGLRLPKGEGIAGHIMATGNSLVIEDVSKDTRFSIRMDKHTGFQTSSIVGTPLKTDDKIFGVIELVNRIDDRPFTDQDMDQLASIAEYAAIAIERAYYNQALKKLAVQDSLTGLKNRWSFDRAMVNPEEVRKTFGTIFSLLIIDVRKQVRTNIDPDLDEDKILKELARILTQTKRRGDEIFRFAENTLVVILAQTYADGADMAKDRVLEAMSSTLLEKTEPGFRISIQPRTVDSEDAGKLKTLISNSLADAEPPASRESVPDLQDRLQPLLEDEEGKRPEQEPALKKFGKSVSLAGKFIRLKTSESGHIRVERLSMDTIGFRISRSHRIRTNDFLDIQFNLDDLKKSLIKRRVVAREIQGNFIRADFYNPPPFDKDLGFYMMN
ncbi:HDOD domain-containing protein [Desulfospira joergensenii]|uniref:HDOD domain-containing protein n=1 Tax=Desulfospira joergensenii TaxID=53329 RepID=UPI0003B4E516|nr:HDOD domain-containing protein [Desulfospira joergensenii]